MRLGFQSVIWGSRIDDLDYMLDVVKACGYEGVELSQHHKNIFLRENGRSRPVGNTIEPLLRRFKAHGLVLTGLVGGTLRERQVFLGDYRDVYLYLDYWPPEAYELLTAQRPYTLAIHPHWFMPIRTRVDVEGVFGEMAKVAPASGEFLRLIVDTAHSEIAEDDPTEFIKAHFDRLAAVHIKDWVPDYGRWSHRYAKGFALPGAGIVKLDEVMDLLASRNYDGWVILEKDFFDSSREQTALDCSLWAAKKANRWKLKVALNPGELKKSIIPRRGQNPFQIAAQGLDLVKIARALIVTPANDTTAFYRSVVVSLRSLLACEVVKLWSYNPTNQEFYLLDVAHESPGTIEFLHCKTRLTNDALFARHAAEAATIQFRHLKDASVRESFVDKEFLKQVSSSWMINVPVLNTANSHHLRFLISIFTDRNLEDYLLQMELLSHIIGSWADYVTGETCASVAGATNYLCGQQMHGVVNFIDAFGDFVKRAFNCQSVTVFLRDDSLTRLKPVGRSAAEIEWRSDVKEADQCYRMDEGLTGQVWKKREMLFAPHAPDVPGHSGKARERSRRGDREEVLFAPLLRRRGEVLGVVRLVNKERQSNASVSTMFTDDDAAKLDAVIQAALPYLELLITQRHQAFALAKLNHELQNPLIGIIGAVDFLREMFAVKGIADIKAFLGVDFLEDITNYQTLMSRLALNAKWFSDAYHRLTPKFVQCDLVKDVIVPISREMRSQLRNYRLPEGRIQVIEEQGAMPSLFVDKPMMQQVFFNLLSNAIKYHDNRDDFKVEIHTGKSLDQPEAFVIDVKDWGIGLDADHEAADRMFLPGVRGADVPAYRDVSGTGIGLFVVREIVAAHHGTVKFLPIVEEGKAERFRRPTWVRLTFPASLSRPQPVEESES